jgi:hypothetical protein
MKNNLMKQSVINTMKRVGIDYESLLQDTTPVTVANRFTGIECTTSALIAHCIAWVYATNNAYEQGDMKVNLGDFDRIRYFVLEEDANAYSICLD